MTNNDAKYIKEAFVRCGENDQALLKRLEAVEAILNKIKWLWQEKT